MATTYFGVDVSYAQGTINWATMFSALGSNGFCLIRAGYVGTSGGIGTDTELSNNQTNARNYGVKRGYYFYVDTNLYVGRSGASDGVAFCSQVGSLQTGEWMVLDFDLASGGSYSHAMDTYAYDFCNAVLSNYGSALSNCILYSSESLLAGSLSWPSTSSITYAWIAAYDGFGGTNWGAYSLPAWAGKNYPGTSSSPSDYYCHQWTDGVTGGSNSGSTYGCTSAHIDQDSFYSLNNTIGDWNLFGYSGSVSPGTLTNATVTNPTMAYSQPASQTIVVPTNRYDQVLFSDSFTTSFSISSTYTITGPATNINQYAYPIGNYSATINGTSIGTNDFGFITANDYGQFPGNLPKLAVQPIVDSSGNLTFDVAYNPSASDPTSPTVDMTINIALLAYPNASEAPIQTPRVNQAYSSVFPGGSPSIYSTYRRIALDDSVGTGSSTIAHGQNEVPNLFYWVLDNSGTLEMQPSTWPSDGNFSISMDATNLYIYVDSANNQKCYYRVYQDN